MPHWGPPAQPRWVQMIGNALGYVVGACGIALLTSTATTLLLVIVLSIASGVSKQWRGLDEGPQVASEILTSSLPALHGGP